MEKQSNNKIVIALLLVIIFILTALCILFATGTISFKDSTSSKNQNNNNSNNNENINNNDTILTKSVNTDECKNSETAFNGITIKLEQEKDDLMCTTKSFTINGKEIKDELTVWINSYTIYDNNVIISSSDTSGNLFTIYSLSSNSVVMNLTPETLNGYWVKSYNISNNKIIIEGKECGLQCGNESSGYPRATFEIEYSNNSFSEPKLVEKFTS